MTKYLYAEDVVKKSNIGLRYALEQFIDSNIHKYAKEEQSGGAFTIYLEFRNVSQEDCAKAMRKNIEQLDDIQSEEDSIARNYAWFLQVPSSAGRIFATITVVGNNNYAWYIIQNFEYSA